MNPISKNNLFKQTLHTSTIKLPALFFNSDHIQEVESNKHIFSKKYLLDSKGRNITGSKLGELYQQLLFPFRKQKNFKISVNTIQIIEVDDTIQQQTDWIINWGYNSRYKVTDGKYIQVALPHKNNDKSIKTFVATTEIDEQPVVLSTMSVVQGNDIEVFELFKFDHLDQLPHESNNAIPVELKRFAKHPIFDLLSLNNNMELVERSNFYSRFIIRGIWQVMGDYMKLNKMFPYYILASHVRDWFTLSGVGPVRLITDKARFNNYKYKQLQKDFPGYWDKNPYVYQAPYYPDSNESQYNVNYLKLI